MGIHNFGLSRLYPAPKNENVTFGSVEKALQSLKRKEDYVGYATWEISLLSHSKILLANDHNSQFIRRIKPGKKDLLPGWNWRIYPIGLTHKPEYQAIKQATLNWQKSNFSTLQEAFAYLNAMLGPGTPYNYNLELKKTVRSFHWHLEGTDIVMKKDTNGGWNVVKYGKESVYRILLTSSKQYKHIPVFFTKKEVVAYLFQKGLIS